MQLFYTDFLSYIQIRRKRARRVKVELDGGFGHYNCSVRLLSQERMRVDMRRPEFKREREEAKVFAVIQFKSSITLVRATLNVDAAYNACGTSSTYRIDGC